MRNRKIAGVLYVVLGLALAVLIGCNGDCPECPDCDSCCPLCVVTPEPGTIIDIVEEGGQATYRENGTDLTLDNVTDVKLDPAMFLTVSSFVLVDGERVTDGITPIFYMPMSTTMNMNYADGRKVEIVRGASGTELGWRCIPVGGGTPVEIVKGSARDIPGCMVGDLKENPFEFTVSGATKKGNAVIISGD